ncbi:hypothetical protein SAMN05216326_12738 [Nitrosomonas marina]|uniref:Uncharacterized protein n=1 Tax=Nitrosomonas marina TaxID=917 RepID=A0A1I0EH31_9PROT|nr:hypothetical protein [Nitrosomonas marina]SET44542.1 hypothetical protein SAMN05216326_12738 [Nitrosomonas marina]
MAQFVFNVAKGKVAAYYERVDNNDPADAAIVILALAQTGIESDAVLKDKETLSDVLAGTTNEVTNANYARKVLTDADIVALAPDHVNDKMVCYVPDQTFANITAGDNWSNLVFCYDPDTAGGTDAEIIPLTINAFSKTPDGSDIIMTAPNGFYEATDAP